MRGQALFSKPRNLCRRILPLVVLGILAAAAGCVAGAQPASASSATAALPDAPLPQPPESQPPEPQSRWIPRPDLFPALQPQAASAPGNPVSLGVLPRNLLHDQAMIWSSPASLHTRDLEWLLPLTGAGAFAFRTDRYTMSTVVSHDPAFNRAAVNTSNILLAGWIAAPIGIWAYGHAAQDQHSTETGILASESILDGLVVQQIFKWTFRRERPTVDDARGRFFRHGLGSNSSFVSAHSLLAWCAASAIAAETRSPWAQAGLYAGSGSVGTMRVLGQKHFPSDVLVGSAIGWLIGHNVVRRRHVAPPSAPIAP